MFFLCVVVCSILAAAVATDVQQCSGQSFDLKNHIQLSPCKKSPCRLKKGSNQHITIMFTPESEMNVVRNHITATIAGLELPFPGVDGANICDKIENEAGEKVSCPLQAGTKYIYKDSFPILGIYPSLELKVHWALQHKKQDIICFEVPAKIV